MDENRKVEGGSTPDQLGDTESGGGGVIRNNYPSYKGGYSGVEMDEEGDGPGKYRVVSSERIVTLGSRAGRPLISFHLPLSSRRLGSDEAVEEVQRLISENTDFDLSLPSPLRCGVWA